MKKSCPINPALQDVWLVSRVVRTTEGFALGLAMYTFSAFLYEKFASASNSARALKLTVWVAIIMEVCILFSEVPTGAFADHVGRKKSVILSFILAGVASVFRACLPFVYSDRNLFILAVLEAIFYSFSFTFYSGCFVAWIVDTVHERNVPEGHGPILTRSYSYLFLSQIVGAVFGLSLYLAGYIFYAFALSCVISFLCALFCSIVMKENTLNQRKSFLSLQDSAREMLKVMSDGLKASVRTPSVIYLMLIFGFFKFLSDLVNYLWPVAMQANFGASKMSPYWFVIVFSGLLMAFLGSKTLEQFNKIEQSKKSANINLWLFYVLVSFIVGCSVVLLGLNSIKQAMPLSLFIITLSVCRFGFGFLSPVYSTLLNNYIPAQNSKQRATILSFGSMFISLLTIVLMFPSSGPSGESTAIGWIIPGTLLVVSTLIIHVLMRRYQRKTGEIAPAAAALSQEG